MPHRRPADPIAGRQRLTTAFALVGGAAALSWVALFNHAPLVFSDTIAYATAALKGEVPGMFSVFYSLFIFPLHQGVSLWPVVFAQCLLMSHLLYLMARCLLCRVDALEFWVLVVILTTVSGLPWISGQIMPDMFTSVLVLGIFLLVFCRPQLSKLELVYTLLLTTGAITTHLSHVPIAIGVMLSGLGIRFVAKRNRADLMRGLCMLVATLIVASSAMMIVNWRTFGEFRLARNSNVFLLAKLLDEGPARLYLETACRTNELSLCPYLNEIQHMTHDDLKWGWESPFQKVGGFDKLEPEAAQIVSATLNKYRFDVIHKALSNATQQLTRFSTGEGLTPQTIELVAPHIGAVFWPHVEHALRRSKQAAGSLPIPEFNMLYFSGLSVALIIIIFATLCLREQLTSSMLCLLAFLVVCFLWNAIVTGGLAGPYDRYFARIIWIAVFAGEIIVLQIYRHSGEIRNVFQENVKA